MREAIYNHSSTQSSQRLETAATAGPILQIRSLRREEVVARSRTVKCGRLDSDAEPSDGRASALVHCAVLPLSPALVAILL